MPRLLLPILLLALACTSSVVAPTRNDEPAAAAEYHAMLRAGSDDPHRDYAIARNAMKRMPRYSTSSDRFAGDRIETNDVSGRPFDRWVPLGPGNIGGRTRALVIDSVDPRLVYAAGVSGGIWKSETGGEGWRAVGDELTNLAVNALVMDPDDRNVLYAGTGEGYYREEVRGTGLPLRGYGIYVSRDAGETWAHLASTGNADFHWVNDLAVSRENSSRLYAATRTGVWRSRDAGATWTRVLPTTVKGGCLDLAQRTDTNGDYLFASCGTFEKATVYRATNANNDAAWAAVLSETDMGRTSIAIAPSNQSVIYALAASNEGGIYQQGLLGVYRSEQNGDAGSWVPVFSNDLGLTAAATFMLANPLYAQLPECYGQAAKRQFINMGWYCNTIAVDPTDPNRVWTGGVDLFRSDDGGKTWNPATYWWTSEDKPAFVHADQHRIVFHPHYDGDTNKTMFVTNDGGVYRTRDAMADTATGAKAMCDPKLSKLVFESLSRNYGVTQFYHGAVFKDGQRFIGGTQDNGTILGTTLGGDGINNWTRVAGGDGGYVAIDPVDESIVYAASQNGNMLKKGPGSIDFHQVTVGLSDQFLFITPFALDPNKRERLWTGGRAMWRSDDSAFRWKRASTLLPNGVSAIAIAPGSSDRVLAGTSAGLIVRSDTATTATELTEWSSTKPRDGFVSSITFDPADANVVYATYAGFGGDHVWRSVDGGTTWSPRSGNLPDMPVHSLAVDPTRRERLYLGTDLGVFVSVDGGETWAVENTGFAPAVTEAVLIANGSRGPAVYAFTHGRGVWRAELVPMPARRRSVR